MIGLIEWLDARGGQDDVFRIAAESGREFGQLLQAVKAAELLDLVDTPKRLAVLTAEGKAFAAATPEARKALWREKLLGLKLFADVRDGAAGGARAPAAARLRARDHRAADAVGGLRAGLPGLDRLGALRGPVRVRRDRGDGGVAVGGGAGGGVLVSSLHGANPRACQIVRAA